MLLGSAAAVPCDHPSTKGRCSANSGHSAVKLDRREAAGHERRQRFEPRQAIAETDACQRALEALARLRSFCDEVLFLNEKGKLCEGSRSKLFVEISDALLKPDLPAAPLIGCLPRDMLAKDNAGSLSAQP